MAQRLDASITTVLRVARSNEISLGRNIDEDLIAEMYISPSRPSLRAIAEQTDCSTTVVRRVANERNLKRFVDEPLEAAILAEFHRDRSIAQIAEAHKTNENRVRRIFTDAGLSRKAKFDEHAIAEAYANDPSMSVA